jgi:hypothetical protein
MLHENIQMLLRRDDFTPSKIDQQMISIIQRYTTWDISTHNIIKVVMHIM